MHVQTSIGSGEDTGVCWSCLRGPNSTPISVMAVSAPRGSRDSTLSPPPLADRSAAESPSSHAEGSVSSAEEAQIVEEVEEREADDGEEGEEEEEEFYRGMGRPMVSLAF